MGYMNSPWEIILGEADSWPGSQIFCEVSTSGNYVGLG